MKAVIIKILISFIITYLGASFIFWDFEWYLKFGVITISDRITLGSIYLLVIALIYCIINLIEINL